MSKQDDYRVFASSCIDLAHRARDFADKARLIAMAEAWRDLADLAGRWAKGGLRAIAHRPLDQTPAPDQKPSELGNPDAAAP